MIQTITWKATKREKMTDGELKAKRNAGFIPANISKRGEDSISVFLSEADIRNRPYGNFRLALEIEGEKEPVDCYLKDMQHDYTANKVLHADLQGLTVGQELDIDVNFELVGDAPGVKAGGILNTGITSVKIRTLPKNIPGSIKVDISELKLGESINITDIKFEEIHTLLEPTEGAIVSVIEPKQAEETEEADTEMAEPEIITEKSED